LPGRCAAFPDPGLPATPYHFYSISTNAGSRGIFLVQLLLFSVGEIRCAIPLADTLRVIMMVKPAPKTTGRPWEAGTINLHGTILPVISMRSVLGLAASHPRLTDMLIIAPAGSGGVALWVDAMSGIEEGPYPLEAQEIPELPDPGTPGLRRMPDGLLLIHDLSLLLSRVFAVPHPGAESSGSDPNEPEEPEGPVTDIARIDLLLTERAKKIARPKTTLSEAAVAEVLKFRLAYREYALEMQYIREVILTGEITPVPGTPDYISGICVVRGEIISLVDLRVLLSIPQKGLTDLNRVIVVTDKSLSFGILADQITGIGIIELGNIVQPEPARSRYVKGVAEGQLTVLDAAALFADPKMVIEDS